MDNYLEKFGLELQADPRKERKVITNKEVMLGNLILSSKPLTCPVLFHNEQEFRCASCLSKLGKKLRCSKCKSAYYCSRECQQQAWFSDHHRYLCQLRSNTQDSMLEILIRLVALLLYNESITQDQLIQVEVLKTLPHHFPARSETEQVHLQGIAERVSKIMNIKSNELNKELKFHLSRFLCNNFEINDEVLLQPIAITLNPILSLMNHDCEPNAAVRFGLGGEGFLYAIQNIPPGEEITISYLDLILDFTSRQKYLLDHYFFQCQCNRCVKRPAFLPWWSKAKSTQDILTKSELALKSWKIDPDLYFTRLNHADDAGSIVTKMSDCFHNAKDVGDWENASKYARIILAVYVGVYPSGHPIIGEKIRTIIKCLWNQGVSQMDTKEWFDICASLQPKLQTGKEAELETEYALLKELAV